MPDLPCNKTPYHPLAFMSQQRASRQCGKILLDEFLINGEFNELLH